MLDTLHDLFFYVCYAAFAAILLHRALKGAVGVGKETPQEVIKEVTVDDPREDWGRFVECSFDGNNGYSTFTPDGRHIFTPPVTVSKRTVIYTAPAGMYPVHTATVGTTADDYSVRQLRAIAKEKAQGRVKNYKNISKDSLFGQLRELRLV